MPLPENQGVPANPEGAPGRDPRKFSDLFLGEAEPEPSLETLPIGTASLQESGDPGPPVKISDYFDPQGADQAIFADDPGHAQRLNVALGSDMVDKGLAPDPTPIEPIKGQKISDMFDPEGVAVTDKARKAYENHPWLQQIAAGWYGTKAAGLRSVPGMARNADWRKNEEVVQKWFLEPAAEADATAQALAEPGAWNEVLQGVGSTLNIPAAIVATYDEVYQAAIKKGATPDQAHKVAVSGFMANAALEGFGITRIAKFGLRAARIGVKAAMRAGARKGAKDLTEKSGLGMAMEAGKNLAKGAVWEGGTEGAQQWVTNVLSNNYDEKADTWNFDGATADVVRSAGIGAASSTLLMGFGGAGKTFSSVAWQNRSALRYDESSGPMHWDTSPDSEAVVDVDIEGQDLPGLVSDPVIDEQVLGELLNTKNLMEPSPVAPDSKNVIAGMAQEMGVVAPEDDPTEIEAYHGGGREFDRPSVDKVLDKETGGQGAISYGWGHYVASVKKVAKGYAKDAARRLGLVQPEISIDGKNIRDTPGSAVGLSSPAWDSVKWAMGKADGDVNMALQRLEGSLAAGSEVGSAATRQYNLEAHKYLTGVAKRDAADLAAGGKGVVGGPRGKPAGFLYKYRVRKGTINRMLSLDKSLKQMPKWVQDRITDLLPPPEPTFAAHKKALADIKKAEFDAYAAYRDFSNRLYNKYNQYEADAVDQPGSLQKKWTPAERAEWARLKDNWDVVAKEYRQVRDFGLKSDPNLAARTAWREEEEELRAAYRKAADAYDKFERDMQFIELTPELSAQREELVRAINAADQGLEAHEASKPPRMYDPQNDDTWAGRNGLMGTLDGLMDGDEAVSLEEALGPEDVPGSLVYKYITQKIAYGEWDPATGTIIHGIPEGGPPQPGITWQEASREASMLLNRRGITGNRYLDGDSRDKWYDRGKPEQFAEDETENYVFFDTAPITVELRNGFPIPTMLGAAEDATMPSIPAVAHSGVTPATPEEAFAPTNNYGTGSLDAIGIVTGANMAPPAGGMPPTGPPSTPPGPTGGPARAIAYAASQAQGAADIVRWAITEWSTPLIQVVESAKTTSGKVMGGVGRKILDRTKLIQSQWQIPIAEFQRKVHGVGREQRKINAELNRVRWSMTRRFGSTVFQLAVEDDAILATLSPGAQDIILSYRKLVRMVGDDAIRAGVQITVPVRDPVTGKPTFDAMGNPITKRVPFTGHPQGSRLSRHFTPDMWDILKNGPGDPMYHQLGLALAEMNAMPVDIAFRHMDNMREQVTLNRAAPFEIAREFEFFPTHMSHGYTTIQLLHANPFSAAQSMLTHQALRLGWISTWKEMGLDGQDPALGKRFTDLALAEKGADYERQMANLVQSLQGIPLEHNHPMFRPGTPAYNLLRTARMMMGLQRTGLLTTAVVPNIGETASTVPNTVGYRRYLRGLVHLLKHGKGIDPYLRLGRYAGQSISVLDWNWDRNQMLESIQRMAANLGAVVTLHHGMNELNEPIAAHAALVMAADFKKGIVHLDDELHLEYLRFNEIERYMYLTGQATDEMNSALVARVVETSQGSTSLPAEKSRLGNSRTWGMWVWFDSYARKTFNRLVRSHMEYAGVIRELSNTVNWQNPVEKKRGLTRLAMVNKRYILQMGAFVGTGTMAIFGRAMLMNGLAGAGAKWDEIKEDLDAFFLESAHQQIYAGAADIAYKAAANPEAAWQLTKNLGPVRLGQELAWFFTDSGPYAGVEGMDQVNLVLERNIAVYRPLRSWAAVMKLGARDRDLEVSIKRYYAWRVKHQGLPDVSQGEPTETSKEHEETKAFRTTMKKLENAVRHNEPEGTIWKYVDEALGTAPDGGKSIARSLRGRKLWPKIYLNRRDQFMKDVGKEYVNKILDYDATLEMWAQALSGN